MNEWRWWLWKWALATQERDFHSWGLKHFAETALSADSFQSFMHNLMHFCSSLHWPPLFSPSAICHFTAVFTMAIKVRRRILLEVVGRLTRLTRTMIKRGEAMVVTVAVLIWRNNALERVNKIFKDIQTKDIQRHSNHLEECLGHCLAKYVSRYTAVHT